MLDIFGSMFWLREFQFDVLFLMSSFRYFGHNIFRSMFFISRVESGRSSQKKDFSKNYSKRCYSKMVSFTICYLFLSCLATCGILKSKNINEERLLRKSRNQNNLLKIFKQHCNTIKQKTFKALTTLKQIYKTEPRTKNINQNRHETEGKHTRKYMWMNKPLKFSESSNRWFFCFPLLTHLMSFLLNKKPIMCKSQSGKENQLLDPHFMYF